MTAPLVVVGDALLDRDVLGAAERLAPEAPVPVLDETAVQSRPGGAALAAWLARLEGRPVVLVTALGDDPAGRDLVQLLESGGVEVIDLGTGGATGEKVRLCAGSRPLLRLDRGGDSAAPLDGLGAEARLALHAAGAVLVADYGRGLVRARSVRGALVEVARHVPIVWDPHPRGEAPVEGVRVATPNRREAEQVSRHPAGTLADAAGAARRTLERWPVQAVAITLGRQGALLVDGGGRPLMVPAHACDGDPCGAGDRFASRVACALADGLPLDEAVRDGVEHASRFVAAGGALAMHMHAGTLAFAADAAPRAPRLPKGDVDAAELAARVRSAGGTVVATGGCFDLLHAGHVSMLTAARALGECLIVCLNSDASVQRLKGPSRPINSAADRRAVLLGLEPVDAVCVFDDDDPRRALERLRPHVWAKAADYAGADLPEATALAAWGGEAVVLPTLENRSTTRLVEEVMRRAIR